MIKNYFKIAFRSLMRNKGFSLINILGLVIGISFSCMLYVYVSHELSYDTFHSKSDRTFRLLTVDARDPENLRRYGLTVAPMGPELKNNYPEVENMVRLHRFVGQVVLEQNGENFSERNWFTTDRNFFDVFDFQFISGDKKTALKEPHSLVLTESMARKYFGDESPVGKIIDKTSFGPVKVTGVIKDQPANSHLKFDLLFSRVRTDDGWEEYLNSWDEFGAYTYIVLRPGNTIERLRSKMPQLVEEKFARFEGGLDVDFQSMEDIYLRSADIENGAERSHGQLSYIYIFSSMGIFLLLIACMNYVNLATSKGMMRSREVGVRKVVGAGQVQLVGQFLLESFVLTFISAAIAIFVMDLAFPFFNQITGKEFDVSIDTIMDYMPALLAIALIIGIISGSYPAFHLAKLKPVSSLRGRELPATGMAGLRNVLVVFQFVITIVMIVSTLVIGQQLNFIQTKDIGFNKERLMVIDINNGNVRSQFRAVKHAYSRIPGVSHVAVSTRVPGEWKNIQQLYVSRPSSSGSTDSLQSYFMGFDEDMLATYQLTLKAGKYFTPGAHIDSTNILLNESAVKALGLADPVGATVRIRTRGGGTLNATVIGIIRDFNFQSLHQKVAPIIIGAWNNPFQYID